MSVRNTVLITAGVFYIIMVIMTCVYLGVSMYNDSKRAIRFTEYRRPSTIDKVFRPLSPEPKKRKHKKMSPSLTVSDYDSETTSLVDSEATTIENSDDE